MESAANFGGAFFVASTPQLKINIFLHPFIARYCRGILVLHKFYDKLIYCGKLYVVSALGVFNI